MIKNFLTTAVRHLLKKRTYSVLNIAGLAIGIACASMIFLWVEDEVSFDHGFANRDYLYQVYENQTYEGKVSTFHATPGPMSAAIVAEVPGVVRAFRMSGTFAELFALGDNAIYEKGDYTDPGVFPALGISFVRGGAFSQLHSIVVNVSMAKTFFGDADPIGKTLRLNNQQDFVVSGVFNDLPKNSSFQFQWLAPMENQEHKYVWQSYWGANWAHTFVQVDRGVDRAAVDRELSALLGRHQKNNKTVPFLFAMNDWRLRADFTDGKQAGGKIQYVRLFTFIAWIILLIACINFMNLSTARSEQRAREVGVRKVMGAARRGLIVQFIVEALVLSFVAVVIAVGLVYLFVPGFNTLVGKDLEPGLGRPLHVGYLLGIVVVTGLVAGSYPAFYLSSFNPIGVLKGLRSGGRGLVRQGLVVAQFTIAIVLIVGVFVIFRQIKHVRSRDLGYTKDNLLYIQLQDNQTRQLLNIHDDLLATGMVADASLSEYPVTQIWNNTDNYSWQGKNPSLDLLVTWESIDAHFLSTMGMRMVAGRGFYTNTSVDSNSVIINEAMAAAMGSYGKVGSIVKDGGGKQLTVVGIVKNFLYNTLYESAAPLLFYNQPPGTHYLNIRLRSGVPMSDALAGVEGVIKRRSPGFPPQYKFVDTDFDEEFANEMLTERLAGLFAVLAIIISCLGLFGLAAYTAERRLKELGIRKVLGASVPGLVGLLSGQFLKLVGIACLIAFPLGWWVMSSWLANYAYHTTLYWWIFVAAGAAAVVIALVTVSVQAVRAAVMSPVRSLRSE